MAMMAFEQEREGANITASASLFDGPALMSDDRIRNGIYVANSVDTRHWQRHPVAESAITLSRTANTGPASDISHSTFTLDGTHKVTFDYWVFTASDHRYMLSYARAPAAKTPDAATFFATATSCPKQTQ